MVWKSNGPLSRCRPCPSPSPFVVLQPLSRMPDGVRQAFGRLGKEEASIYFNRFILEKLQKTPRLSVETMPLYSRPPSSCSLAVGLCQWQEQILDQSSFTFCDDWGTRVFHDPQFSLLSKTGTRSALIALPPATSPTVSVSSPPTPAPLAKLLHMLSFCLSNLAASISQLAIKL